MTTIQFEDIVAEARSRFEPISVGLPDGTAVELKPIARLSTKTRRAVIEAIEAMKLIDQGDVEEDEDDEDLAEEIAERVCAAVGGILRQIATSPRKLIAELDAEDDILVRSAQYTAVLKSWTGQA